jgi:Na+:H+ antiporter, NhaA family
MNTTKLNSGQGKPRSMFQRFFQMEAIGGILLLICAVLALIWANSLWSDMYFDLWSEKITIEFFGIRISESLGHWVNDGLMAVFFFVVGLEIKREILNGELSSIKKASLPILAALGGMIVPAALFLLVADSESANGWGIPMATDIAFALGILMLLGDRIPLSLKIFLTALAIIDDIGAVIVIAVFYTSGIVWNALLIAGALLLVLILMNRFGVKNIALYLVIGIVIWYQFLVSGIHTTVAGVLVAFTIPVNARVNLKSFAKRLKSDMAGLDVERIPEGRSFLKHEHLKYLTDLEITSGKVVPAAQRLEHKLHGFVAFFIMPVFAIANAGVNFSGGLSASLASSLTLAIFAGLIIGKSAGIFLFSWLGVKLKLGNLPEQSTFKHIVGLGLLGGIGFTMSLFIAGLAFDDPLLIQNAKIGVIFGSLIAGLVGYFFLKSTKHHKIV